MVIQKLVKRELDKAISSIHSFSGDDMERIKTMKLSIKPSADLQGADLRKANLRKVNLREADLRGADLRGADLRGADLRGADLREANLQGADLREADLREADLQEADLRGADLREADLRGADLREANLDYSSGIPFWCGGQKLILDSKQLKQLVAHTFAMDSDDPSYLALREAARSFASGSHIANHLEWLKK